MSGADAAIRVVAYLDAEPVGWCAVEPRTALAAYERLGITLVTPEAPAVLAA